MMLRRILGHFGFGLLALVTAASIAVTPSRACAAPSASTCSELFEKGFARSKSEMAFIAKNKFTKSRSLLNYDFAFAFNWAANVSKTIARLAAGAKWMDMGAGEAKAIIEVLRSNQSLGEAIAISHTVPKEFEWPADVDASRFTYLKDDFVENMARNGQLDRWAGQIDVITDLYGPFSYTNDVVAVLQTYLDLLKPGGVAFINLMNEEKINGKYVRWNSTFSPTGGRLNLIEWIAGLPGVEVVATARQVAGRGDSERSIAIKIKKTAPVVIVPTNLEVTEYMPYSPPRRSFVITPAPQKPKVGICASVRFHLQDLRARLCGG